jgi:hypothetical protein
MVKDKEPFPLFSLDDIREPENVIGPHVTVGYGLQRTPEGIGLDCTDGYASIVF